MELTKDEIKIIEKWRELKDWGSLEAVKQNDKLFELRITNKERVID